MGSLYKWARWRRPPKGCEPRLFARRPDQRRHEKHQRLERPGARPGEARGGGPPARALPASQGRQKVNAAGSKKGALQNWQENSMRGHWKESARHGSVLARANVHSARSCMTLGERAVGSPPNTSHLQEVCRGVEHAVNSWTLRASSGISAQH